MRIYVARGACEVNIRVKNGQFLNVVRGVCEDSIQFSQNRIGSVSTW